MEKEVEGKNLTCIWKVYRTLCGTCIYIFLSYANWKQTIINLLLDSNKLNKKE